MGDVSKGEGRTVLFVSHNMDAVMRLCTHAILLKDGYLQEYNNTKNIIDSYLRSDFSTSAIRNGRHRPGNNMCNYVK